MTEPTPSDVYRAPNSGFEVVRKEGRAPSRLGLAALALGVAGVAMLVATFVLAFTWKVVGEPSGTETDESQNLWIGFVAMGSCCVSFLGVCVAILALLQPDRARVAAVSGLVINAFVVLAFAALLTLGLMAGE